MNALTKFSELVNEWLEASSPVEGIFTGLNTASGYALRQGGKRFRPVLCLVTGEVLGVDALQLKPYAIALEMIHAASLVHDDLPGLDNSEERRGRPAVHREFGEAAAILTGDLLISEAFRVIAAAEDHAADVRINWVAELSAANAFICSGQLREIAGQSAADELGNKHDVQRSDLIIQEKTAALIRAAVMGAPILLGSKLTAGKLEFWSNFGTKLGMLFQLRDDQLDNEAGEQHQSRGERLFGELIAEVPAGGQLQELVEFVWERGS